MRQSYRQQGFTIIETLIVLAIAGLLAMFVFLAIPTLQRNARNNQRKNGAASILQALSHFELSNSGAIPPDCAGAACLSSPFIQNQKLIFYDGNNGTTISLTHGSANAPVNRSAITNTDTIQIYNYQRCSDSVQGAGTSTAAGYNDVVALYALERGSGTGTPQCQEL